MLMKVLEPAARVFYISFVFSNVCSVLSQCNTWLRISYLSNNNHFAHIHTIKFSQRQRTRFIVCLMIFSSRSKLAGSFTLLYSVHATGNDSFGTILYFSGSNRWSVIVSFWKQPPSLLYLFQVSTQTNYPRCLMFSEFPLLFYFLPSSLNVKRLKRLRTTLKERTTPFD